MKCTSNALPQMGEKLFLTDGGLETVLIFDRGIDLPHFAAFDLLKDDAGIEVIRDYYLPFIEIARSSNQGFVLDTPTWRASADWMTRLGHPVDAVQYFNENAAQLMLGMKQRYETAETPIVVAGAVGPRGDGYAPSNQMNAADAEAYHRVQIAALKDGGVDYVSAVTFNYVEEAIGFTLAARNLDIPATVGFTTETDGCLPGGQSLADAIRQVDQETANSPAYYMLNCAHFDHFEDSLVDGEDWTRRIGAIRANASRLSHAELDECEHLDDGDPEEFGQLCSGIRQRFADVNVFGGCCGTDHRHVEAASRLVA